MVADGRSDMPARYSLIIYIRTPETDVDLYAAIEQKLVVEV
jgi:hypothetical protein